MAKEPWGLLRTIGWMAIILGSLSAFRLFTLDWPGIYASIWCGCALIRRKPCAFLVSAVAGGMVLADALLSLVLLGPLLLKEFDRPPYGLHRDLLPFLIPQLLLYATQAAFWPWVVATVLRNQQLRGIPGAYTVHTRATVIGAFCVSAWISLVVQMWAKVQLFRLV